MSSFATPHYFFSRQSIWILVSVIVFLIASQVDWRFLRLTRVIVPVFVLTVILLGSLLIFGETTRGIQGWFRLGPVAFQPSDLAKLVLIIILAKYFSRRHIEIRNIRHILVSGIYAFIIFVLIFLQPDF